MSEWAGETPLTHAEAPFGVVVVNYGSHELLRRNLVPATRGRSDLVTVVVDNHSSDAERAEVTRLCSENNWVLVGTPNDGYGAGMNAGVTRAMELGCSVFVLLNPDLAAGPGILTALAEQAAAEPDTLTAPRILRPNGQVWFGGGVVRLDIGATRTLPGTDSTEPTGWLTGACLAVHRDLWNRLGGFDGEYFLYWEDVDLSWRCTAVGGRLLVRDDLTVVHSVGGTQQAEGKSLVYYYYNCRNRLVFARKHLDRRTQRRWARKSLTAARLIVLRGGKRQFLRTPWQPIWAAVSGTVAGLRFPSPRRHLRERSS